MEVAAEEESGRRSRSRFLEPPLPSRTLRAAVSKLVEKLIASPYPRPVAAAATRSFNTGFLFEFHDGDLERRPDSSAAASRARGDDSFIPTRSLDQVLSMMDQMLDSPFVRPVAEEEPMANAGGLFHGWEAKEDNDALHLRIDMPGLGKEQVKGEKNTLVIKGEGEEPGEEGEEAVAGRRYSSRIDLPPESYRLEQIRAEMKNGVLKLFSRSSRRSATMFSRLTSSDPPGDK